MRNGKKLLSDNLNGRNDACGRDDACDERGPLGVAVATPGGVLIPSFAKSPRSPIEKSPLPPLCQRGEGGICEKEVGEISTTSAVAATTATKGSGLFGVPVDTVISLLREGERYLKRHGIENSFQETQALLQALLSLEKIDLYTFPERPVSKRHQTAFFRMLERRGRREPLQYLLGEVDFCGLSFLVSPGVFIPRPETELIVQIALSLPFAPRSILDLCTGSGVLAISLARRFPSAKITAIDCSRYALAVARSNQKRHHTPHIVFIEGDLFHPLFPLKKQGKEDDDRFDLIVCNPPYIAKDDWQRMDPEVLGYEPHLALFSPKNGRAHLIQILMDAPRVLAQNGYLLLEMGAGQSSWLLNYVKRETPFEVRFMKDVAGIDRVAICQWTKS